MEGRRRASQRRSQNKKPPRGYWQPRIPAWEKEFCKVVGSMDWETLLQMKRFMHLYDKVMEWNDSACEEAFTNAKKRYWASKNGLSCHVSLPDPDLYIDKINWDSDNDPEMLLPDVVSLPASPQTEEDHYHDPVVIFGDSAIPDNVFATVGWGDGEENFVAPAACSSANYLDPWNEQGPSGWSGYHNNGWQGYSNDTWQYSNGSRPWGGDWGWNYANHCYNYAGTDTRDAWGDGRWNDNPATGFVSQSDSVRAHP